MGAPAEAADMHPTDAGAATTGGRRRPRFPAYGPIEGALGLVAFYLVIDRATPAVVAVLTDALEVGPGAVRFGLAAFVWFVLAVTVLDHARRQLVALGVGGHAAVPGRLPNWAAALVPSTRGYLVLLVVGGTLAALTVEVALAAVDDVVRAVGTLEVAAFPMEEFALLVVFAVSYGLATQALDRLVIDWLRDLGGPAP